MAVEQKEVKENQQQQDNLTDIEIAELANEELLKRGKEIQRLNKEIAKLKLYSEAPEEEEPNLSRDECLKVLADTNATNYDICKAAVSLHDISEADGEQSPLGKDGKAVRDFLSECLEACGDDKSRFPSVYQAMIGDDPKEIQAGFNARNKRR